MEITPTDDAWVPAYLAAVGDVVARHNGTYLARTTSHERLEGDGDDAAIRVILQWPTKQEALAFMNDPDYVPHLAARTKGSDSHHFLIEGKDDVG